MAVQALRRVTIWLVICVLAVLPKLGDARQANSIVQDSGNALTAPVTVSVFFTPYGEESAAAIPIPDTCVKVSTDDFPIARVCDGDELDKDARPGFIGFHLLVGVYYNYELDWESIPSDLPPDNNGYFTNTPYEPLPASGAEVSFEFTSCHPYCAPFLSWFVSLPTGDEPRDGQRDGVPVDNACFILRLEDGSTLPEQCSSLGEVDFPEVELTRYQIEPTRLPDGCTVEEIDAPQPFEVTEEVIDFALSGNSWGNFYAGDIYLTCDPARLAKVSLVVVECPEDEMHDGLPCNGTPVSGAGFTFSEEPVVPPLLTGADGTDSISVLPGELSLARLGNEEDSNEIRSDYVADVICTETGSQQVLVQERIYGTSSPFTSVPFHLPVAAGDDVRCAVDEYISAA